MKIRSLSSVDAHGYSRHIVHIYRNAWAATDFYPGDAEASVIGRRLVQHASNPDFKLCVALEDRLPIGFAYGYTSVPGGWWRQLVTAALEDAVEKWFEDCFELAELAVLPDAQGGGVGAALHDALLDGLQHSTAMLSTQRSNDRAVGFYLRRGWVQIEDDFYFPNRPYPYVIMGLDRRAGRAVTSSAR